MNESEPPSSVAAELTLSSNDCIVVFTSVSSVDVNQFAVMTAIARDSFRFARPKELVLAPRE